MCTAEDRVNANSEGSDENALVESSLAACVTLSGLIRLITYLLEIHVNEDRGVLPI